VTKSVKSQRDYVVATAFIAVSFLLGACSGSAAVGSANGSGSVPTSASQTTVRRTPAVVPKTPAVLDVSPADLATGVLPNAPVTVRASRGTVGAVTLVDDKGNKVEGKAGSDGTWRASTGLLRPSTGYTFTIAAVGPDGTRTSTRSTFKTLKPAIRATYGLIPSGGTVGVGMPVSVQFASAVSTKARRAEVE